ncbi:transglutaminase domain-containing protein [Solibacillus sp. FSL W7-1464]|uniref:transglutaminase domain-containing protein n=1 Tax=Solibacillus sp. FSL W7-1464 TaxID=2921706 RepID=UPI0030FC91C4
MNKFNKYAAALFLTVSSIAFIHTPAFAESLEKIEQTNITIENPSLASVVDFSQSQRQLFSLQQNVYESSNLRDLSAIITSQANQYKNEFAVKYSGDSANLKEELSTIFNDYLANNDYANGTVKSFSFNYGGTSNNVTINIKLEYHNTIAQEEFISQEVKRIAKEIIEPEMSEVEKIKAINDYIVLNTTYSYDTSTTPHSAYALFNEGKGVCQAYALAAYRLLKEANFEVRYVTGYANEPHAWNLVKVDGEWYHLDTTWNDPVFGNNEDMSDYVRYKYFLISDKEINKDHTIDNNGYPAATSDRFIEFRTISSPVTIGNTLYFENQKDDIKLYKLNMNTYSPKAEKVSDTRVQYLTYANDALYFSNYSSGAHLYKMNLDGTGVTLLVNKLVTKIDKTADELIAYSNNEVIYREPVTNTGPVTPPDETPDLIKIAAFSSSVEKMILLSSSFRLDAEKLFEMYEELTNNEKALVSVDTQNKFTLIDQYYKKLIALKFTETVEWDSVKTVKEINKQWAITLSHDVENFNENFSKIYVVDMFGEKVGVDFEVNGNTINVIPESNYTQNIVYTLVVPADLKNKNGDTLGQGVHLQFIVKP